MKKLPFLVPLALLVLPLSAQNADLRGLKTVVSQLEGQSVIVGRQYAVMIAIDKYTNWMALRNPVKDAKEIKEILSRRYYISDFMELYDAAATKAGIIKLFDKLISDTKPEDSILIYYAGHGHLDKSSNSGFWIPVDGGTDVYDQANWLPNSQIRGFISNLKARHVALIADSCFSGDFLNPSRGMAPTITNEYFKNAYARVSRQVLTSGASEAVPDESPFARQLKLTLEGSNAPYLDPLMLYNDIRLSVTQTTPLFGDLKDSGHQEGSSFLFFLKSNPAPQTAQEPSTQVKIAKVYGTATVETDATGTLFLDGISQGQVPVGSLATIENLAAGPHEIELLYDDGQKDHQTVMIKMGKTSAVEFTHTVQVSSSQPAPAAAAQKSAPLLPALNGAPVPTASIKIDGSFDDWQSIPPVVVGSSDTVDISAVSLAMDDQNLYIKIDTMDKTPSSFLHPDNFKKNHDSPSYGITIKSEESRDSVSVRLFYSEGYISGWLGQVGVVDKDVFQRTDSVRLEMKGASAEIALPLARISSLAGDLSSARRWRVFGWTAKGGIADAQTGAKGAKNWGNAVDDLRQTEAGFFSFPEHHPAPVAAAAPSMKASSPLIKIDGNFDDWKDVKPVAAGSPDATDNMSVSRVFLAVDAENLYVRLDVADKTPTAGHNFAMGLGSPFYAVNFDDGTSLNNINLRLVHEDTGHGWFLEWGVYQKGTFRHLAGHWWGSLPNAGPFAMKGSSVEAAVPLAKVKSLLADLGPAKKYRVFGWSSSGWDVVGGIRQTEPGFFAF